MIEEGRLLMSSSGSPSLHLESLFSPNASSRWERSPLQQRLAVSALSCLWWTLDFAKEKNPQTLFHICWSVGGKCFPLLLLLHWSFGLRRRKRLDEEGKHPGVQGVALNQALSHDALKEFRSGSDFRVFGQGFWVKTHPNVSVPAHTSLRQACSMQGYSSFRLLSFLLLLPELFSPDQPYHTRPVPCWVPGIASVGKAKCVNRMGEGSWLRGVGCLGTGSSRGTQGMGILGEVPAPHVLCFLMCLSRHRPVASNLPVTSLALNIQDLLKGRTVLRCLPFAGRSSACFPWPGDPVHPWKVSIHHLG